MGKVVDLAGDEAGASPLSGSLSWRQAYYSFCSRSMILEFGVESLVGSMHIVEDCKIVASSQSRAETTNDL
jgi:hypothetical protein